MEKIFEQYGDLILSVLAGMAFILFFMGLIAETGILGEIISSYEATVCVKIPFILRGGM